MNTKTFLQARLKYYKIKVDTFFLPVDWKEGWTTNPLSSTVTLI